MAGLENVSIKISNYKCFADGEYGYDIILPVNLIIGRNNSGKSTLLDLMEYATSPRDLSLLGYKGQLPRVTASDILMEEELQRVFSKNSREGFIVSLWEGQNPRL